MMTFDLELARAISAPTPDILVVHDLNHLGQIAQVMARQYREVVGRGELVCQF